MVGHPAGPGDPTPGRGPRPHFVLAGTGVLAGAVAAAMAAHAEVMRIADSDSDSDAVAAAGVGGSCALVVAVADEWDTSLHPGLRQACAAAGLPWLPLRAELGTVVVFPDRDRLAGAVEGTPRRFRSSARTARLRYGSACPE